MKTFLMILLSFVCYKSLSADKSGEIDFSLTSAGIKVTSVEGGKECLFSCKIKIIPNGQKVKTKCKEAFKAELIKVSGEPIGTFFFEYNLPSGAEKIGDEFHYKSNGNSLIELRHTSNLQLLKPGDYIIRIINVKYFTNGSWREFKPNDSQVDMFSSNAVWLP